MALTYDVSGIQFDSQPVAGVWDVLGQAITSGSNVYLQHQQNRLAARGINVPITPGIIAQPPQQPIVLNPSPSPASAGLNPMLLAVAGLAVLLILKKR